MKAAAPRHTGLPFVPQQLSDELLGSWLLRVAQLYGLGWKTLLSRLDAHQASVAHLPHWFAIDGSTVSLDAMAAATRQSRVDLKAGAPHRCRPHWPQELGARVTCLTAAAVAGQPNRMEPELDEPTGDDVQHPWHLAYTGGDASAGRHSSRRGS